MIGAFIRIGKEFGFPVALSSALLAMLWWGMVVPQNDREEKAQLRQEKLVDSITQTNLSLVATNDAMATTLDEMREALMDNDNRAIAMINSNGDMLKQVGITHQLQTEQLGEIKKLMDDAAQLMAPVPKQREDSLKKQDETNATLRELVDALKKS